MEHLKVVGATWVFGAVALGVVPVTHAQVAVVAQDGPYRSEIQTLGIGAERTEIGVSIRDVEEDDPHGRVGVHAGQTEVDPILRTGFRHS